MGLGRHLRDSMRHILAGVLVAGTLAGTTWTFSAGMITLSGAAERWVSVGGIAAALEVGFIYLGWYIGQLDLRILGTRRRELAVQLAAQRADLMRWFYGVAAISGLANLVFRTQQLHNVFLAAFVSAAPVVLVILFCIKLRPLPDDYRSLGARATGEALTRMVDQAGRDVLRLMQRMGRGQTLSDGQMRQLSFAASVVRIYAQADEQHALDHALQLGVPQLAAGGAQVVDAEAAVVWWRTADVAEAYEKSLRTAQGWIQRVPERRRVLNSTAWEAPREAVVRLYGDPRSARHVVRDGADDPHGNAAVAPLDARGPQVDEGPTPSSAFGLAEI
jgi:hypothetical protein